MVALWLAQGSDVPRGAAGPMMLGGASVSIYSIVAMYSLPEHGIVLGSIIAWLVSVILWTTPMGLWLSKRATKTSLQVLAVLRWRHEIAQHSAAMMPDLEGLCQRVNLGKLHLLWKRAPSYLPSRVGILVWRMSASHNGVPIAFSTSVQHLDCTQGKIRHFEYSCRSV